MSYFTEKARGMHKHAIRSAVIVDTKGIKKGIIIVRYTDSSIGWNSETGINFYDANCEKQLSINDTVKDCGSGYCKEHIDLFEVLTSIGAKVYDSYGEQFINDYKREGLNIESISDITSISYFKIGNRKFKIMWV